MAAAANAAEAARAAKGVCRVAAAAKAAEVDKATGVSLFVTRGPGDSKLLYRPTTRDRVTDAAKVAQAVGQLPKRQRLPEQQDLPGRQKRCQVQEWPLHMEDHSIREGWCSMLI